VLIGYIFVFPALLMYALYMNFGPVMQRKLQSLAGEMAELEEAGQGESMAARDIQLSKRQQLTRRMESFSFMVRQLQLTSYWYNMQFFVVNITLALLAVFGNEADLRMFGSGLLYLCWTYLTGRMLPKDRLWRNAVIVVQGIGMVALTTVLLSLYNFSGTSIAKTPNTETYFIVLVVLEGLILLNLLSMFLKIYWVRQAELKEEKAGGKKRRRRRRIGDAAGIDDDIRKSSDEDASDDEKLVIDVEPIVDEKAEEAKLTKVTRHTPLSALLLATGGRSTADVKKRFQPAAVSLSAPLLQSFASTSRQSAQIGPDDALRHWLAVTQEKAPAVEPVAQAAPVSVPTVRVPVPVAVPERKVALGGFARAGPPPTATAAASTRPAFLLPPAVGAAPTVAVSKPLPTRFKLPRHMLQPKSVSAPTEQWSMDQQVDVRHQGVVMSARVLKFLKTTNNNESKKNP
jgi:hypothetical protein